MVAVSLGESLAYGRLDAFEAVRSPFHDQIDAGIAADQADRSVGGGGTLAGEIHRIDSDFLEISGGDDVSDLHDVMESERDLVKRRWIDPEGFADHRVRNPSVRIL